MPVLEPEGARLQRIKILALENKIKYVGEILNFGM